MRLIMLHVNSRKTRRAFRSVACGILAAALLTGCGASQGVNSSKSGSGSKSASSATANTQGVTIPDAIQKIPDNYYTAADQQGTLDELEYNTWESFSYDKKSTPLTKHAIVYLPYGYDDSKQYDIFYLMHGGWSDYTTTLGTPDQPTQFKNVVDNAIAAGEIEPMIIVCPTYNNTNEDGLDSNNFSLALQLTDQFHNELLNDLMPAVEGKYSTYANGTTPEDFAASRDHRGFGGFSMGSVTTWRTFEHDLDYFHYFLPMSCGTSLDDDSIWQAAKGRDQSDYFVFVMTGTDDFAYSHDTQRTKDMAASDYFTNVDDDPSGNMAFRVMKGFRHDNDATMTYTYNGMRAFFGPNRNTSAANKGDAKVYNTSSKISDVMNDSALQGHGRLLFPTNDSYYSGDTLGNLSLTWYNDIDPDMTVDIVNDLHNRAANGETVFYDIYTDAEKQADPDKEDTGLFFFKGKEGAKTAIVNAGGGFAYVGAMQDSFPVALTLSQNGYNAFALIYRPGAQTASEDLSRAIAFLSDHADQLGISMKDYSLWGGSAGARMVDWVGTYGTAQFGEKAYPKPAAIVMQYTGLSEVTGQEPPTYANVGTSDGIASYRTMQRRINAIKANGTDAEIDVFKGLSHGFGLGTGTVAEGWINHAIKFWERNVTQS